MAGRGSNRWISVHGQALFTFHMTLREPLIRTPNSNPSPPPFMNLVTLTQHLVALAIVFASRRILADRLGLIRPEDPEPDLEWIAVSSRSFHSQSLRFCCELVMKAF